MIGFNISAKGSYDFSWNRGAWTEGSLWLAKAAFLAERKTTVITGLALATRTPTRSSVVGMIEEQFKKIRDILLNDVANLGLDLCLTVTGDINFVYNFDSTKSAELTALELLQAIADGGEDMRDQVMIYFCNCLLDFQRHAAWLSTSGLWLNVYIDL